MALQHFFPLVIDSTQLAAMDCPIKFFRQHIQHLQQEESVHLIAGAAFAHGIHVTREAYYTHGLDEDEAVYQGIVALQKEYGDYVDHYNENKSVQRMSVALEAYFAHWQLSSEDVRPLQLANGKHSLEYSLMQPIRGHDGEYIMHPTLNVPLLFSGRLDMLAEYMGKYWMVDEKTTSGYFSNNWGDQWELRGQFSGYAWLAEETYRTKGIEELHNLSGVLVRGISLPASRSKEESKRQQYYMDTANVDFRECVSTRSEYDVQQWHNYMLNRVVSAKDAYMRYINHGEREPERFFTGNFGSECTSYSRACTFMKSCKSPHGESFLEVDYPQVIWLPNEHRRRPLEDYLKELDQLREQNG